MSTERQKSKEPVDPKSRTNVAWGDIGSTLARIGVPLDIPVAEAFEPHELELPLIGGSGAAPREIEVRRFIAAVVRQRYDDVFHYEAVELPLEGSAVVEGVAEEAVPEPAAAPAQKQVEVQAINRKTGQPIKVKLNMLPAPHAAPSTAKPGTAQTPPG